MKSISWTGSKGNKIELRAYCTITMEDRIVDLDGDVFVSGKEPSIDANLELWVDEKKVDSCWDTNFWKIIDTRSGYKKIWGLPVGMTDELAAKVEKFLKDVIESGKSEEVKAFEADKAEKEKAERRAEAQRIVDEAAKCTTPLMTNAEYKAWRKQYNDIHNEGGEGYIPERITVEQLEYAKKILAEQ